MRWAAIALAFFQSAAAQTLPTLRSDTRVVQVDVVAKDSRGRIVEDLSKEDFTLKDEGRPRAIGIFSINRGEPQPPPLHPYRPCRRERFPTACPPPPPHPFMRP